MLTGAEALPPFRLYWKLSFPSNLSWQSHDTRVIKALLLPNSFAFLLRDDFPQPILNLLESSHCIHFCGLG